MCCSFRRLDWEQKGWAVKGEAVGRELLAGSSSAFSDVRSAHWLPLVTQTCARDA